MNRILCYLRCESRAERERNRLKDVAAKLTDAIGIEGIEAYAPLLDDGGGLILSVCCEWKLEHEPTHRAEALEGIEELIGKLQSAVARLEGGAA